LLRPLPLINRTVFSRVYYDLSGWLFAKITRSLYRGWIARANLDGPHPWRYERVERAWKLDSAPARVRRVVRHPVDAGVRRCAPGTAFAVR
jgi:hypothetical protein